ncbi:MAG TPA: pitrilysin family protein [Chloroflexia bacterium]|nr:pitrilysin family protein [Chloroflexia bacterium]
MPESLVSSPPAARPSPALGPDSVTRRVLPNGLVVLVYPNPTIPAVNVRLSTRAGAMFDPPALPGLAGMTATAMRRGTRRHTFAELNEMTDDRGLSVGVESGYHLLDMGGRSLREDTPFLFELMAEVLREPSFPDEEIERLRSQWITGLLEQEDDTRSKSDEIFRAALYPEGHPYHQDPGGTLESIRAITRADLEGHYSRYVRPEGAILVLVGDITPETALALAEKTLGDWQVAGEPPPFAVPDAPLPEGIQRVHHTIAGKTQNDLVLGFPTIRRSHPDYYALDMMNLILGRLGLYGRLGKTVREDQGLAYYAYSGVESGFGPGPWTVRAGVNPANVGRAVQSILAEMTRIQEEPVSAEELARGQRYVTGTLPLRLETNSGIARQIAEIELFGLGWDYIQRYPEIIRGLTVEDVQRAARTYLHPDRYVLATAGPDLPPA